MLVGEDHVGGEGSCWWERIMLSVEDNKFCRIKIPVYEQHVFLHRMGPYLSVRNKNRSKLYVFSPPTRS